MHLLRFQILIDRIHAAPYTVLGWAVTDIRAEVRRLTAAGLSFERYNGMDQDPDAIWQSPAGTLVAWFRDPEGQILSLSQFKS